MFLMLGVLASSAGCGLSSSAVDQVSSEISFAPDAVLEWNANALVGTSVGGTVLESRTLAIMHIAIHDALNSIRPRYRTYAYHARNSSKASLDAAVAAAAHDTLVARCRLPGAGGGGRLRAGAGADPGRSAENANSRVLCGIHFRFATIEGLRLGRVIGAHTAALFGEDDD